MSTNYISQITATDGVTYDIQEGVTTRIFRATCTTSAGTAAKVATLDDATGYSLTTGVRIAVTFKYGNTATSPSLNVNNGGAKNIHYMTAATTAQKVDELCVWGTNETVIFTYNGSSWTMMGSSLALYNAYNKAASSGSGTITEVKTNAGAHTTIDVLSGKAEFNVPTKTSHLTNDSGFITSYTETDPTVPSWAKASTKPTYTASEVGALPDTTIIPTKTSDLTNDSGFITSYTDTKNTAGSTNSTSQLYLIGATEQSANPQTYSNDGLYINNEGTLITQSLFSYGSVGFNSGTSEYIFDNSYFNLSVKVYTQEDVSDSVRGAFIGGDYTGLTIGSYKGNNYSDITTYLRVSSEDETVEITNLAAPVNNTDAATKKYVDDSIGAIPAASITLNGTSTTSASFYAPTAAGSSGQYLQSNGSGAPTWADLPTDSPDTLVIHLVRTGNETGSEPEYDIDSSFSIIYALYNNNKFIYLIDTDMERIYYLKTITPSVARFSRIDYSEFEYNSSITKTISEDYFFINSDDTIEFHQYSSLVPIKTSDLTNDSGFVTTDEKLKWTTSTSSTTYYPLQSTATATTSTANTLNGISFYQYYNTAGGYRRLNLGNSTAYTSAGGAYGKIRLYGTGATYYGDINPGTIGANSLTANRTWTLPDASGTIALTSDIPTSSTITLNGTSTTSASFYAPTTVGNSGQFLKSSGSGAPSWSALAATDIPTLAQTKISANSANIEFDYTGDSYTTNSLSDVTNALIDEIDATQTAMENITAIANSKPNIKITRW